MFLLSQKKSIFFPYEKAILDSVAVQLNEEAREIFNRQINLYNRVDRLTNNREINMYFIKWFKSRNNEIIQFPLIIPEIKLAKSKVMFKNDKGEILAKIPCEVWLVSGHVFSMHFKSSPTQFIKYEFEVGC